MVLEQTPALVLGQEPHAIGKVGEVNGAIVVELHVVGVVPGLAHAILVAAQDPLVDDVHAGVDVALVGHGLGHLVLVGQTGIDPLAGLDDGGRDGARRIRVLPDEIGGRAEGFLRMVLPDVLRGDARHADAVGDRPVAPGLAHTVAVHVAHPHVGHHLGRWHCDDLHVLHRVDAVGGEPVVQPHRVGAGGKGLGEGVLAFFDLHQPGQRRAVDPALVRHLLRQRDRLPVVVQVHEDGHVLLRPAYPQVHAVDEAPQYMGHVQLAVDELVAHAGPAGFLGGNDLDAVLLVDAEHRSHHHAGAVGQGNEADLDFLLLGRVGALGPDGRAQGGRHPDRADGRSLQDGAAGEPGSQKVGHHVSVLHRRNQRKKQRRPHAAPPVLVGTPSSGRACGLLRL